MKRCDNCRWWRMAPRSDGDGPCMEPSEEKGAETPWMLCDDWCPKWAAALGGERG